jgi:uncharacterized protein with FMN-binding domain
MKRVIVSAAATIAGLVALLNFKTQPATTTAAAPSSGAVSSAVSSSPTTTPAAAASGTTGSSGAKTVTGSQVGTRYGPVEVKVTVTNGKITSVDAVEYPTDRARDVEINSKAVPLLNKEALSANSAKIDTISGATYTSNGYKTSLQSALDKVAIA